MNQQLQEAADRYALLTGNHHDGRSFLAGAAYMQDEAVKFACWCSENCWAKVVGADWWSMPFDINCVGIKTTSELYAIYKQSLI